MCPVAVSVRFLKLLLQHRGDLIFVKVAGVIGAEGNFHNRALSGTGETQTPMKVASASSAFDRAIERGDLTQLEFIELSARELAVDGVVLDARHFPRTDDDYEHSGNVLLDGLFGARVHVLPVGVDPFDAATRRAEELEHQGRRAHVIPSGGSTAIGSLGYVRCAMEIVEQEARMGETFRQVLAANGSSGTHAGGGVCGIPGWQASRAALADKKRGLKRFRRSR